MSSTSYSFFPAYKPAIVLRVTGKAKGITLKTRGRTERAKNIIINVFTHYGRHVVLSIVCAGAVWAGIERVWRTRQSVRHDTNLIVSCPEQRV